MELKLLDNYFIKTDELQFILYIRRPNREFDIVIDEEGKKSYKNFFTPRYCGTLYQAIDLIKEHEIRNSKASDLDELRADLKVIDSRIKKIQDILSSQ